MPSDQPAGAAAAVGRGPRPKSPEDAAFLRRWDRVMRLPIILAAVLPLVVAPEPTNAVGIAIGIASWLVFLADYVVHQRRFDHYLGTRLGKFDLAIVIFTSPWYLLPGASNGGAIVLLRLIRRLRLVLAARGARRLFERLGRVALVALSVVAVASAVAFYAERPTNPGFATYGDALWWGYVTLTTVGYGDIVPKTTVGRLAGVVIMTSGIAVLGVLAGSLASFFRLSPQQEAADTEEARRQQALQGEAPDEPGGPPAPAPDDGVDALTREVADLRDQIRVLTDHVVALRRDDGPPAATAAE